MPDNINHDQDSFLNPTFSGANESHISPSEPQHFQNANPEVLWNQILDALRQELSPEEFSNWVSPIKIKAINHKELYLLVPNSVFYQGLIENYWPRIEACKTKLNIDQLLLSIQVEGHENNLDSGIQENDLNGGDIIAPSSSHGQNTQKVGDVPNNAQKNRRSQLNHTYTFNSFVSGESNRFAQAATEAVANSPGQTYNPLFIYGGTGLGKTHLLHAVGNHIRQNNPSAKITYISSESFMNEMIYSLRFNKMWGFRQKYRHCDVFLVDDIQFISGKERTQEEFFHTFNSLYETKKQIVITSDMFPQDIPDIEERLRNRFQWGLIADIQPPDLEHRIAILYEKSAQMGFKLDAAVASYIASNAKRNVRELEGALHRIAAFASLQGRNIDLDLAIETFQNVLGQPARRLSIELIQKTVSEHFKIRLSELKSKKRLRALTVPRQIAMYLSRELTNASFPEIGDKFGGKDHTTVMHAVRKIEKEKKDLNLRTEIEALQRKLEQLC